MITAVLLGLLILPVSAMDITAPAVPESGAALMPAEADSFGEGVLEILRDAVGYFRPDLKEAARVCVGILVVSMLVAVVSVFPGHSKAVTELTGTVLTAGLLLQSSNSLISLGAETVEQISEYGKLLLPVMSTALAAQGGVTSSAALYAGTAIFDAFLSSLISKLLVPMIYLYLALATAAGAVGESLLKKMGDTVKWAMTWGLKIVLYVFTGYIGITGVVSGTTDAAALKAAKLTISGVVPVVGGILSDASEAVLVGAGVVKNAAGIYGLLAILAVWIGPFLRIGAHYLMLKVTEEVCGVFDVKSVKGLLHDFSAAMGILLAMTGTVCLMLLISTVCFMKGVG